MSDSMIVVGSVMSDVGSIRSLNEDSARLIESSSGAEHRGWLAVVADGMGGHSGGEVASRLAVDTIAQEFSWESENPSETLLEAVRKANQKIYETAAETTELSGMGTTCTAAVLIDWQAHVAHVGDSRLYLVRSGDIFCLTEDDSSVMDMVRRGVITREEAKNHEDRNVILRALGTRPQITPSSWPHPLPLQRGDRLILSSDGLHDLVDDDEILRTVTREDHRNACSHLVDSALHRGGPDNITVVVLSIDTDSGRRSVVKPTRSMEAPQL